MKKTLALVALCVCVMMLVVNGEEKEDVMAEPRRGCHDACPALFDPVCAQLGNKFRTFGNDCERRRYNCKNNQRWRTVSHSVCRNY